MESAETEKYDPFAVYDPSIIVASDAIEIDAPPMVIWGILVDMPRYGEWNPFCVWAESTLEMGAPVNMRLVNYANPGSLAPNCEYICAYEPGRMISWEFLAREDWPYPARRDQIITQIAPDRCRYQSTDAFTGPNGIHVMRFCGEWVKRAFDDSAKALKTRAEAMHRGEVS